MECPRNRQPIQPSSGFVLAGGKSLRIGSDKATTEFHGHMLLDDMVRQVSTVASPVRIVDREKLSAHRPGPILFFSIISLASEFNTIESPACQIVSSNHPLEFWWWTTKSKSFRSSGNCWSFMAIRLREFPTLEKLWIWSTVSGRMYAFWIFGCHICPGSALLEAIKKDDHTIEVIFLTGEDETYLAVEMMKRGALDYLLKPVDLGKLSLAVTRALEHRRLVLENEAYHLQLERLVAEKTQALNDALQV